MNADARRCSVRLIGVNRRVSAVPYPRRYEGPSLSLGLADTATSRLLFPFLSVAARAGILQEGIPLFGVALQN